MLDIGAVRRRTLRSLAVPNYRRYFAGSAVSVIGTWMQRVAQDWLVLDLSHSAVALGIASALQFIPVLFAGPWGGAVVDRHSRRRLLIVTQSSAAVLAAVLAALTLSHSVALWMVYVLAFGLGVVTVFDTPGRQAFLTELVAGPDLVNAQALYSTAHNAGRLIGPALAGVTISAVGVGWAFAINAFSFLAVLRSLTGIDPASLRPAQMVQKARGQVTAGIRYVWDDVDLRRCAIAVLLVGVFAQNFRVVLPLIARRTLHGDASTYGWLTAALGLGAVVGALTSAAREHVRRRTLGAAYAALGVFELGVASSPGLGVALAALMAVGVANLTANTLSRTLMLTGAAEGLQGRVMAIYSLVFLGSSPIGGPAIGWLCGRFGARAGMVAGGIGALAACAVLVSPRRHAWQRDAAIANRR